MAEDGTPERVGRLLGRLVVRGRDAARKAVEPESQERVREAARTLSQRAQPAVDKARETWAERGPDIAEVAAQRAVDGAIGAIGLRFPFLRSTLAPLADQMRQGAGSRARELAASRHVPAAGDPVEVEPAEEVEPAAPTEAAEDPEAPSV